MLLTLAGGRGDLGRVTEGTLGVLNWQPASFLVVSLIVRLIFAGVGDLALVTCSETLFLFEEATAVLGAWRDARGTFLGVSVAFFGVLGLGTGSPEAPPGALRVGMGSFEAPLPGIVRGGGTGRLDRPLLGAVAPRLAVPLLAVPPPEVFLMGTGSLDFQAVLVPVPKSCLVDGGTATPLFPGVPASLLAVGGGTECLPALRIAVVFAMSFV